VAGSVARAFTAVFGILLLIAPGASLISLVQVLGFYLFIEGILRIVSIFLDSSSWGLKVIIGILGIIAGLVVLNHPLWSAIAIPTYIVYVIGFLAIFEGVGDLIQAFREGGWGAGILGILVINLRNHHIVTPPDRRGRAEVFLGSVHASGRHCCDRGVVPSAFESYYHK
jgi:uncharacterized membrane protein HdeD (DUF308 family)